MDRLIRYVCTAREHGPRTGVRGDLTVYARSWAFCPAEAADGHEWRPIEGVTVNGLERYGLRDPKVASAG